MKKKNGTAILLAGMGAMLLMSGKKKSRSTSTKRQASGSIEFLDQFYRPEYQNNEIKDSKETIQKNEANNSTILENYLDPDGRAQLGMLYQIKSGDLPLEICREALFGSRFPVSDPILRRAAIDLLVRIDCSPWNQANYGVPLDELDEGHAGIDGYFANRGVSFNPIYKDNKQRILDGLQPSSGHGSNFALIWIPMINLDRFDMDGVITTEGMYHPDTEDGIGGSMIDPPQEILNLGFDEVSSSEVGCSLPEGDFRRILVSN